MEVRFIKDKLSSNTYDVVVNNQYLGMAYKEVDGFYVWWPRNNSGNNPGFFSEEVLRQIADKLLELNIGRMEILRKELK